VHTLGPATEDEMVLEFLRAEAGPLVNQPDVEDEEQNARRRTLLVGRGYGLNAFLFQGFPQDVAWEIATLTIDELSRTRYIEHDDTWRRAIHFGAIFEACSADIT